jgi:hypothetical protein
MHMLKRLRFKRLRPALAVAAILICGLMLAGAASALAGHSRHGRMASRHTAHGAGAYLTGLGDEQVEMFGNPLWQQLHTKIARYIAPYDAAVRPYSLQLARRWIAAAEAQHQQVLVAFYHSEYTPTRMPSVAGYQRDVQKFVKLFPKVRQYQPWNEANRGNVRGMFSSPSATVAADYYRALKLACRSCTVLGLDILDQQQVGPSMRYIADFKHEIARLKTPMPSIWGLHDYSDTNRFESSRTRAILAAVPGQVWLTETGGVVKFGGAFPNIKGSGLTRAAKALSYMFRLASSNPRIKRLYIFQWSGSTGAARFDAGLTDPHFKPRPGYVIVCEHLHGSKCRVKTSRR